MSDVSDTLYGAAEYISEHGWCQNSIGTTEGQVCAMGAIFAVCGIDLNDNESPYTSKYGTALTTMNALRFWIMNNYGDHVFSVPLWNDKPKRTAEDVILAMKRAAEENE